MLRSILVGLDTSEHAEVLAELGIRWARRFGASLAGLAIVDEPGIRAIEPLGPIGGTPGVNPVYYVGYENRMAEQQALRRSAAGRLRRAATGRGCRTRRSPGSGRRTRRSRGPRRCAT